jgi:LPS O-antigen subunit length determinant protein (WzzB/FepE family)
VAAMTEAIQNTMGSLPAASSANAAADNPAYIQIKAQREATLAQAESLAIKRQELQAKIVQLDARLAASPAVERDYITLLRELDSDQLKYREVQQKQEEAQLAENLEDEQKGERFTLIDPPLAPEEPVSPNRWLIVAVGLVVAIALGIGVALLLESKDHSVRNRQDLESLVQTAPLAVVPMIFTSEDYARRRRRRSFALAGTVGVIVIALVLTHLFYRPLDVLWDVALRKLGG